MTEKTEELVEVDDVDERVEEARQLSQQLKSRREEKRESIRDELQAENTKRKDEDVFTGWVHGYESAGADTSIIIHYVDQGEELEERFTLRTPVHESQYTIENEFVRFVQYVGDGDPTDVESTLEREVPLKKTDGSVELDLPDVGIVNKATHRLRRTFEGVGINISSPSFVGDSARMSIAGVVTFLAGLYTLQMVSEPHYAVTTFLAEALLFGLAPFLVVIIPAVLLFIPFQDSSKDDSDRIEDAIPYGVFLTVMFAAGVLIMGFLSGIPVYDTLSDDTPTEHIMTTASQAGAITIVTWYALSFARGSFKRTIERGQNRVSRLRRRWQLWRGIEHVQD